MSRLAHLTSEESDEFTRRLPKVELHCHLAGMLRPGTLIELAAKYGIPLPDTTPEGVYDPCHQPHAVASLNLLDAVISCIKDRDDFARVAHEALVDSSRASNLKYMEIFFNPAQHAAFWATPYADMADGLIEGMREAERETGVKGRFIASINREQSPAVATQLVRDVIDNPRDEIVGIGMDANEALGPPEAFQEAYELAGRHRLRRTAHAGEWAFPRNVATSIETLGCDRIDHGYFIAAEPVLLQRAKDSGLHFTCCWSTSLYHGWPAGPQNPIVEMWRQGLSISLNSDDPQLDGSSVNRDYVAFRRAAGADTEQMKRLALDPIDHLWADEGERRDLRRQFNTEIQALESEFATPGAALTAPQGAHR
ncbi:adenosine deaminase [Streptomyces sp. NBC_01020]|uniref:adenosine deaminase n=1 Tax=Streptomyces sp. NBC_01020 TaxID=2903722 RepID=UPI0038682F3E|nr:adenosine deaminase [Streptomyces sp. NBC_01020]